MPILTSEILEDPGENLVLLRRLLHDAPLIHANCNLMRRKDSAMTTPTRLPVKMEKTADVESRGDWSPFERLRADVDRLFSQLNALTPWRWTPQTAVPSIFSSLTSTPNLLPAVDFVEHEKEYRIVAELPGLDEKSVAVKLVQGTLVIKGEKTTEKDETEGEYHVSERRFGSYQRSFTLPDGIDVDKIQATFSKGILTVTLPKTAEARKETKIAIKAA